MRLGGEVLTSPPEYLWKQRRVETPIPVECISTVETNSRDNVKIQVHQDQQHARIYTHPYGEARLSPLHSLTGHGVHKQARGSR